MALDYLNVQPDIVKILPATPQRYNTSRGGKKIKYITRHHTAGVLDAAGINRVWADRPASAHYLSDPKGLISQHVWDAHVAWSNANAASNAETISIEHSNSGGEAQGWPINDVTIVAGAKWAAALCLFYGLGRPKFGTNIRDHREFTGTSCPHHLANGGKYHDRWMQVAQQHYDYLVKLKAGQSKAPTAVAQAVQVVKDTAKSADIAGRIKSLVNGEKLFTEAQFIQFIDARTWRLEALIVAICEQLKIDYQAVIEAAEQQDKGGKHAK